ncbi:MAG: hypothetical protein MI922_07430 [Bacteroidales bacterium]|nr:hypothetical protein [Bacteroidales bacterium]
MEITRSNYEIYIIDYYDGALNEVQTAELMLFLANNPDLEEEFIALGEMHDEPVPEIEFPDKENLKKTFSDYGGIDLSNFDEFCIAYYEGDLNSEEKDQLTQFIGSDSELQKTFEDYGKVYLEADPNIIFPNKKSLKQQPEVKIISLRNFAYAASVAAAIVFSIILLRDTTDDSYVPEMVNNNVIDSSSINKKVNISVVIAKANIDNTVDDKQKEKAIKSSTNTIEQIDIKDINVIQPNVRLTTDKVAIREELIPIQPRKAKIYTKENNSTELQYAFRHSLPVEKVDQPKSNDIYLADNETNNRQSGPNVRDLSFWTLAETGIKGYNLLTESDISFTRVTNANGQDVGIRIKGDRFSYAKRIE